MPSAAPELYWISGSPPSWRVMLGLVLKGVEFRSYRLNHEKGENRTAAYLRLNPLGQVPTLRNGDTVVRESLAILAYLDRAWPEAPIFGANADQAARIWQQVMIFETALSDPAGVVVRKLIRAKTDGVGPGFEEACARTLRQLSAIDTSLREGGFLAGPNPSAADLWLYPLLGWLDRAIEMTTAEVPDDINTWSRDHKNIRAWRSRFAVLPGVGETYPPHWKAAHSK